MLRYMLAHASLGCALFDEYSTRIFFTHLTNTKMHKVNIVYNAMCVTETGYVLYEIGVIYIVTHKY